MSGRVEPPEFKIGQKQEPVHNSKWTLRDILMLLSSLAVALVGGTIIWCIWNSVKYTGN